MINIFIGYDEGEKIAYSVLSESIRQHSSEPVSITPLDLSTTRNIFTRKKQGFKRNLNDIVGKKVIEELYDNYVNKEVAELLNISKFYQKIIKNYPNSIAFQLKWRLLVFGIWFENNKHSIEWQN